MTRPDRRRRGRTAAETRRETSPNPVPPGLTGGRYQPLTMQQVTEIVEGTLHPVGNGGCERSTRFCK